MRVLGINIEVIAIIDGDKNATTNETSLGTTETTTETRMGNTKTTLVTREVTIAVR